MNLRGLLLFGWAGLAGAAELSPAAPAAVQVKAVPDAAAVIPDELPMDTSAAAERIDRFALEGPRFLKDVTRIPLVELRKLAPVRSEQAKKAANLHDPVKVDEFRTLSFDGLEIYGFMGDQGELWPIRITVSSAAWDIADDLKVGSDAARVLEILGEPATRHPQAWLYQGVIQNVNFYLRQDKVEKIEFIYYLD